MAVVAVPRAVERLHVEHRECLRRALHRLLACSRIASKDDLRASNVGPERGILGQRRLQLAGQGNDESIVLLAQVLQQLFLAFELE